VEKQGKYSPVPSSIQSATSGFVFAITIATALNRPLPPIHWSPLEIMTWDTRGDIGEGVTTLIEGWLVALD